MITNSSLWTYYLWSDYKLTFNILQLEVEVQKLFVATITNFFIQLLEFEDLLSLLDYIKEWKPSFWETCFFREFKSKDGIWRSKLWG
jgi:hypothetical protein